MIQFKEFSPLCCLLTVLLLLAAGLSAAQSGQSNPFELQPRLENLQLQEQTASPAGPVNPFDLIREAPPTESAEPPASVTLISPEEVPEVGDYQQFLFAVMITSLLYMALLFILFRSFLLRAYRGFFNDNMLSLIHRDQGRVADFPYLLFYLLFCFEWIFPVEKEVRQYSFTIIIFSIILGLVLAPFNLFIAYGPAYLLPTLFWVTIGVMAAIYLYRTIRGIFLANRFLAFHQFHFLLYICTVEIAPVVILVKVILSLGNLTGGLLMH